MYPNIRGMNEKDELDEDIEKTASRLENKGKDAFEEKGIPSEDSHPASPPSIKPDITVTPIGFLTPFGPESSSVMCPHCHTHVKTEVAKTSSTFAIILGFAICMLGGFCGCCLIPCCMDSLKTTEHICPNCRNYLGKYTKHF